MASMQAICVTTTRDHGQSQNQRNTSPIKTNGKNTAIIYPPHFFNVLEVKTLLAPLPVVFDPPLRSIQCLLFTAPLNS